MNLVSPGGLVVAIPIHGAAQLVERCVESVVASMAINPPFTLELRDDASPDAEIGALLDRYTQTPGVRIVRQPENLGFTRTANAAMDAAWRDDVILLNSDTVVANDWVARLRNAAHSAPDIASVTPFSNNATIASFPEFLIDNALAPGQSVAQLDRAFSSVNSGQTIDIPTAVGFCMYIRRDAIDRVGLFDAVSYPRGYGEENDWCMRALAAGLRNVLATEVYVFHKGGSSFGESRRELMQAGDRVLSAAHPHYGKLVRAFIDADPPRPFRERALAWLNIHQASAR